MIENIFSRGTSGPELAALRLARLFGIATGGSTRIHHGKKFAPIVHRYGLSTDVSTHRQTLLRNIRRAEGTLVFGMFGAEREALLKREGRHYCCLPDTHWLCVKRAVAWIRRHGIRTLNVIGKSDFIAQHMLLEIFCELGHKPAISIPEWRRKCPVMLLLDDGFFATLAGLQTWRWDETAERWVAVQSLWQVSRFLEWNGAFANRFWQQVPEWVRECAESNSGDGDLKVVETLGWLGKPAEDLFKAGRWALLEQLVHADEILPPEKSSREAILLLIKQRQRDILGYFGFPATEAAVHIMAKVRRGSCGIATLNRLRELLASADGARTLSRLPHINDVVVQMLADPWLKRIGSPRLIRELALERSADEDLTGACGHADYVWFLKDEAQRAGKMHQISTIKSIRHLEQVVDHLIGLPDVAWPPPRANLPGITGLIEPLASASAIADESTAMDHCVRTYTTLAMSGQIRLFRILADEKLGTDRATVELRPGASGQWQVVQLCGIQNRTVSHRTQDVVETWRSMAHVIGPITKHVYRD